MKNIFKKMLAFCLVFTLLFTVVGGVVNAEETKLTATMGTLKGTHKFGYNIPIIFEEYAGADVYGADVAFTSGGQSKNVTVEFEDGTAAKTVIGVSNISLNGIANEFTVTPWVKVGETKISAESFTASYIEWLLSKKDAVDAGRVAVIKTINDILDLYASIKGEAVYEGQEVDLEAAPEMGQGKWVAANAGTADVKGSFSTADGKNYVQADLGIKYPTANIFADGDFENFTSNGNISTAINSDTGSNAWKLPANKWVGTGTPMTVKPNTKYEIKAKFWVKTSQVYFRMSYLSTPSKNQYSNTANYSTGGANWDVFNGATGYQELTVTFTTGSSTELYISAYEEKGGTYIDDIIVREAGDLGYEPVINNGFDTSALRDEWKGVGLGFEGAASTYDGGKVTEGKNPIDGSMTWAWLHNENHNDGTKVNLKANTHYLFTADVYVPAGKTISFAISDTDTYKRVNNDALVMKANFSSVDNGSWRTVTYDFNSGDYSGDFWLTVMNRGSFTGTAGEKGNYSSVRYDSVKIVEVPAGARVYSEDKEIANITFVETDTLAVGISNISFANMAKQYTIVPYVYDAAQGGHVNGEAITVSYADFLARALNKGNADQKAQAYAIVKAYKAAYGVDLVVFEGPKNLVVNSSFANGNEGWSRAGSGGAYAAGTFDALKQFVKEGDEGKVFSFNAQWDKLWQYVKVEKNTTYTFSFDYFRFAAAGWFQARIGLANQVSTSLTDGKIVCDNNAIKGEKTWETFTTTVNSGDYEYICIYLVQTASANTNWDDYVNGKNIWVDNVRLVEAQ